MLLRILIPVSLLLLSQLSWAQFPDTYLERDVSEMGNPDPAIKGVSVQSVKSLYHLTRDSARHHIQKPSFTVVDSVFDEVYGFDRVIFVYGIAFFAHSSVAQERLVEAAQEFAKKFIAHGSENHIKICSAMVRHNVAFVLTPETEQEHLELPVATGGCDFNWIQIPVSTNGTLSQNELQQQLAGGIITGAIYEYFRTAGMSYMTHDSPVTWSQIGDFFGDNESAYYQFVDALNLRSAFHPDTVFKFILLLQQAWASCANVQDDPVVKVADRITISSFRGFLKYIARSLNISGVYSIYYVWRYPSSREMQKNCPDLKRALKEQLLLPV
ncbi:hypothetical protein ACWJJH_00445 [Endozoicomonadaceae bacterium StTr2]